MAKGDKRGNVFYITVQELAKACKVMYHSWKHHVWCVTWYCNIKKQTCSYTLCHWCHYSLMKSNCEMSNHTTNIHTVPFRHHQWWWGKICASTTHRFLLISNGSERILQRVYYTGRLYLMSAVLTLKYSISIGLSFSYSCCGDDISIPWYELPAAVTATLIKFKVLVVEIGH